METDIPSRSRGDRYALSALRNRRAEIAARIVELERQLRHQKESLVHVDACLKLLDPDVDPTTIANKRLPRRVKLFGQGQLGRMILEALRVADGRPLSTAEIVDHVLREGGHDGSARKAVAPRVRGNLSYLCRRGAIAKIGARGNVKWALAEKNLLRGGESCDGIR